MHGIAARSGRASLADPFPLTATAAPHEAWQSCASAVVTGCGGFGGSLQVSWIARVPPAIGDAVKLAGGGGPLLSTTTGGLCTVVVFPAAFVRKSESVCGPSRSRAVSTPRLPTASCGQGCVCV